MGKLFSNRKLVISLIGLIIVMLFLTFSISVRNNKNTPPLIQQIGNDTIGISAKIVNAPADFLGGLTGSLANLSNTYEENERLAPKVDEIVQNEVKIKTLENENKSLKEQLDIKHTLTDYNLVPTNVIDRSSSNWENQIIIDKGSKNGVYKNMTVLSDAGVAGRVSEVNKLTSKVELISSDNLTADRFSATVYHGKNSENGANGVISGFDRKRGELKLQQITNVNKLAKGDKVVTSGFGGTTPQGLLIGTVDKIEKNNYGLSTVAYISPAADISNLSILSLVDSKSGANQ